MNATDTSPATSPAELPEAEAVALLGTQDVGRLVYTRRALPAVTPVNFLLRDGAIWIWTASTSSMWPGVRGAVVAFEVDELDAATRSGWSVVVLGVAELVTRPQEIEDARRHGPEPWVAGRKEHLIRIPLELVSGRRIVPEEPGEGAFDGVGDDSPPARVPEGR
jgi:nitroimidazol reductase NimA-like FMN-containing flavoprotein (pyridoxamine 5'-phosphate oxidase superfamily)